MALKAEKLRRKKKWTRRVSPGLSSYSDVGMLIASVAAEKHAAFVRARGRHYSNEAEAMKVCVTYIPRISLIETDVLSSACS